jgi:hypothetical protein
MLNAIVRLSVFIQAAQSQQVRTEADAFCRVHDLHYQIKDIALDGLHYNFRCYTFAYRKDIIAPVLAYRTKWHGDCTK